jgi:hypothetical protein
MSSFADLKVKCETIEFNSNPLGNWTLEVPYNQLLSCKSITSLANTPETQDETLIPYPFAFRYSVTMKVIEFLKHISNNHPTLNNTNYDGQHFWEMKDKEFFHDFIDIPICHPDYGYNNRETKVTWTNRKGINFVWDKLPVIETTSIKTTPDENNKIGVTMFIPNEDHPVTITDLMSAANTLKCKPLFKFVSIKFANVLNNLTIDEKINKFMIHTSLRSDFMSSKIFSEEFKRNANKYIPNRENIDMAYSSAAGGGH